MRSSRQKRREHFRNVWEKYAQNALSDAWPLPRAAAISHKIGAESVQNTRQQTRSSKFVVGYIYFYGRSYATYSHISVCITLLWPYLGDHMVQLYSDLHTRDCTDPGDTGGANTWSARVGEPDGELCNGRKHDSDIPGDDATGRKVALPLPTPCTAGRVKGGDMPTGHRCSCTAVP